MNVALKLMNFAFKMVNFAFKMMDFALKLMNFAFKMMDFATGYGWHDELRREDRGERLLRNDGFFICKMEHFSVEQC